MIKRETLHFETRKLLIISLFIRLCQNLNYLQQYITTTREDVVVIFKNHRRKKVKKSKSDFTNKLSIKKNNEISLPKIIKREILEFETRNTGV